MDNALIVNKSEIKSPATMADVAKAVGVTKSAVSLALKNHPRVSEARRKEIKKVACELGYYPNVAANRLAQFKRNSKVRPIQAALGWLNFWNDPEKLRGYAEFEHYWQGALKAAEIMGYRLEEFTCSIPSQVSRLKRTLQARGIEGLIIPPGGLSDEWSGFQWDCFSVIRINRRDDDPDFYSVASNRAANAMLAFDTIAQRGYQRIGFVGAPLRNWFGGAGFLWAQHLDVGSAERLPVLLFSDHPAEDEYALNKWVEFYRPDAILTDRPELKRMLERLGRSVPRDIGVASLGVGGDFAVDAGVFTNPEEIGRVSASMLIAHINEHKRGIPLTSREVLINGTWMDGKSLPRRFSEKS